VTPVNGRPDDWAVFVKGICPNGSNHAKALEQIAVVKVGRGRPNVTGGPGLVAPIDQAEADKIIRFLKAQPNVNRCETCHARIDIWSSQLTSFATYMQDQRETVPLRLGSSSTGRAPGGS